MNGRTGVVWLVFLACSVGASAQTAPQRDPQAVLLLQKSLSALSGGVAIQDVTLTGTVRRVAGSSDDSGNATLKGTAAGDSLTALDLPSGNFLESRETSVAPPTGSWEGTNGTVHPIAQHNLLIDPTWFYPALLIERALADADYGLVYVGAETRDGATVQHVRIFYAPSGAPTAVAQGVEHLSQAEIYLDSLTALPLATAFLVHPDNDARTDIPVGVRFSDYVREGTELYPNRIRRYLQNGLVLDIQVTGAQFNTGLSSGDLSLQ